MNSEFWFGAVNYPTDKRQRKITDWRIIKDSEGFFRITGRVTHDPFELDFIRFTESSPIVSYQELAKIATTESGTTYVHDDMFVGDEELYLEMVRATMPF